MVTKSVVVLGSGVIGVTAAYALARDGHQVTVIDRQDGPALETSFGNAGEISPGYSSPWAGPGVPAKIVKWLMMEHPPLALKLMADPAFLKFCFSMLSNCTEKAYAVNKARMVPIAEFSRDQFKRLRADLGIRYDDRQKGTLQLFRSQKQLDHVGSDTAILDQYQVPYRVLDRDGCVAQEPAFAGVKDKFVGGLLLPNDETGDCFKFTNLMAEMARELGVRLEFGTVIKSLIFRGEKVSGVTTSRGDFVADSVLVALGSWSAPFLKPVGIHLPVYPVKGYSLTMDILDASRAPVSTVLDETYKVAVTRLGDRVRVGGMAELSGYNDVLDQRRRGTLRHVVDDLFPGAGDSGAALFWTGLRPMTPDGPPILGPTKIPGLVLATGHGTLGWTMSAGTAEIIAAVIGERESPVALEGLTLERYG